MNERTDRIDVAHVRHVHLIAICGVGMGSLAGMLKARGLQVTGSDAAVYPPMSEQLAAHGIPVLPGYHPAHLTPRPDLVVVGNAISKGNPEGDAAIAAGIPYVSMAEAARLFFFAGKKLTAVCGTHGKTTSTALLSWILENAGCDPTYLVGGVLRNTDASFRVGQGPLAVVEGDEYDTAWFDKVPKFLRYRPDVAALGNIEFDHADIYPDLDAVRAAFRTLAGVLPADGFLAAGIDSPEVRRLLPAFACPVRTFGFAPDAQLSGRVRALDPDRMTFQVTANGRHRGIYEARLVGDYNLLNILGVMVLCDRLGVDDRAFRDGLETFAGVRRRQQIVGEAAGILVIDDFAHHPTAVRVTLAALRDARPNRRLVAAFEPRTNTSRRNVFQQEYAEAFDAADFVVVCDVQAAAKAPPPDKLDVARLVADIRAPGRAAERAADYDAALALLAANLRFGDQVVFLSNGGFGALPQRCLELLQVREKGE